LFSESDSGETVSGAIQTTREKKVVLKRREEDEMRKGISPGFEGRKKRVLTDAV